MRDKIPQSVIQAFAPVATFIGLSIILGLWEVGWLFSRLPLWYYGYALLPGIAILLAMHLLKFQLSWPSWKRALAIGWTWAIPVMSVSFGIRLLEGEFSRPEQVAVFVAVYLLIAPLYGALVVACEKKGWA